jgi:flagellar L-ring protein precursor FlgH
MKPLIFKPDQLLRWLLAMLAVSLAACAVTPESIVQKPLTARPVPPPSPTAGNGSIYQASAYRPLFEDRRARLVGDVITITINENTSAGKQAGSSASKTGSVDYSVPTVAGLPLHFLQGAAVSGSGSNKYEDKGSVSSSNTFISTLGVTVIEVLSNGNLVVAGEKQIALDKGAEFIRFSGVISPDVVAAGNVVSSTQVADAKVEYRTNSRIDRADLSSWMARFFMSVLPI